MTRITIECDGLEVGDPINREPEIIVDLPPRAEAENEDDEPGESADIGEDDDNIIIHISPKAVRSLADGLIPFCLAKTDCGRRAAIIVGRGSGDEN